MLLLRKFIDIYNNIFTYASSKGISLLRRLLIKELDVTRRGRDRYTIVPDVEYPLNINSIGTCKKEYMFYTEDYANANATNYIWQVTQQLNLRFLDGIRVLYVDSPEVADMLGARNLHAKYRNIIYFYNDTRVKWSQSNTKKIIV